ncbi:MAG: hypothetical protein LUI07_04580 [Lachnospiraceae bacterium]|nr:hypothetical protein [Lachnospiraceae bacterium]
MEKQELINEVIERIRRKLSERGLTVTDQEIADCLSGACGGCGDVKKPGLLVLTQEHGTNCHPVLESPVLQEKFRTECALMAEYQVDLDGCEAVVLFDLTNEALAKLRSGIADTPYTALAQKALLSGKKLYAAREEIELFRYQATAPAPYYAMLVKQLEFLMECGLKVCSLEELEGVLAQGTDIDGACGAAACGEASVACPDGRASEKPAAACCADGATSEGQKTVTIAKKVVTERDIIEADRSKVTCIYIGKNTILTDLAKDAAASRDIVLVRD